MRDTQRGSVRLDGVLEDTGGHRPALAIDVHPVGLVAQDGHLSPELPVDMGRHLVRGSVRAVYHHLESLEIKPLGQGLFDEFDVAPFRVINAEGLADIGRGRAQRINAPRDDQFLDLSLDFVGKLQPVAGKEFDAVIFIGIVGG